MSRCRNRRGLRGIPTAKAIGLWIVLSVLLFVPAYAVTRLFDVPDGTGQWAGGTVPYVSLGIVLLRAKKRSE